MNYQKNGGGGGQGTVRAVSNMRGRNISSEGGTRKNNLLGKGRRGAVLISELSLYRLRIPALETE